jgi:uncharacterized membrane protein YidH (DUF202 family)
MCYLCDLCDFAVIFDFLRGRQICKSHKNEGDNMSNKNFGFVLILVGIALAIWGYNVYDSAGSQVSRALSGDAPIEAWAGMVGGAICVAIGINKLR